MSNEDVTTTGIRGTIPDRTSDKPSSNSATFFFFTNETIAVFSDGARKTAVKSHSNLSISTI